MECCQKRECAKGRIVPDGSCVLGLLNNPGGFDMKKSLLFAVRKGKKEDVRFLIEKGVDINAGDRDNMTPLHWASAKCHDEIVRLLVNTGVDVHAKTVFGEWTALHMASAYGFTDIVKILIEAGSDVNARDRNDWTPLHWAAFSRNISRDLVELLLNSGADINAMSKNGTSTELAEAHNNTHIAAILKDYISNAGMSRSSDMRNEIYGRE